MTDIIMLPEAPAPEERSGNHYLKRLRDLVPRLPLPAPAAGNAPDDAHAGLRESLRAAKEARNRWLEAAAALQPLEEELRGEAENMAAPRLPLAQFAAWSLAAGGIQALAAAFSGAPLWAAFLSAALNAQGALSGGRLSRQALNSSASGRERIMEVMRVAAAHGSGLASAAALCCLASPPGAISVSLTGLVVAHVAMAGAAWRRALPDRRLEWMLDEWKRLNARAESAARECRARLRAAQERISGQVRELDELEQDMKERLAPVRE